MEIKRKLEMLIATNRRFVVRQSRSIEQIVCAECGAAMLTAEQSAKFFRIGQREIFQLIEQQATHFAETETGAVMICLSSLADVLEVHSDGQKLPETEK